MINNAVVQAINFILPNADYLEPSISHFDTEFKKHLRSVLPIKPNIPIIKFCRLKNAVLEVIEFYTNRILKGINQDIYVSNEIK